jgi:hypothetical protein
MVALFLFLTGVTGALAPFSYLVYIEKVEVARWKELPVNKKSESACVSGQRMWHHQKRP